MKPFVAPFLALFVGSLTVCTSCSPQESGEAMPGFLEAFDREISQATERDEFSGAVLLAKDGIPFFRKAYGVACRRYGVLNRVDTSFNLGSMNKMFTTVAIAELREQGRLDYDDVLSRYLGADWISPEAAGRIRIRHLLTHTGGTGSFFNDTFWKSARERFREVEDYKELLAGLEPAFEPGSTWQYSNSGFILLGAIVESVSGQDYYEFIRANVYGPAGMDQSGEFDMDEPVPNLAIGYGRITNKAGKETWISNLFYHSIRGSPAGGGFATVDDLLKFDQAMRSDRLLRRETRERLWTPVPGATDGTVQWGYGFITRSDNKLGKVVFHSGGFLGISSILEMYVETGFTVVILSNLTSGLDAVRGKIPAILEAWHSGNFRNPKDPAWERKTQ